MLLLLRPIITARSLQFSWTYYIAMSGSAILLWRYDKWDGTDKRILFFMALGILINYLDLLSYPLATFGIPFTLYLCVREEKSVKSDLWELTKDGIGWCVGYGGMWIGKWVTGSLITGENMFTEAISSALIRSSTTVGNTECSRWTVVAKNFLSFSKTIAMVPTVIFCLTLLASITRHGRWRQARDHMTFLVVACAAPVWYFLLMPNHSSVHHWFTSRALAVTALAGMCFLVNTAAMKPKTRLALEKQSEDV